MSHWLSRTELIYGTKGLDILQNARIAVFGIGGVGGYAVEALARSGIGTLDLVDSDTVCESNLNRQIHALHSTLGKYKVDVAKERILDINPRAIVNTHKLFFSDSNASMFNFAKYNYVVDAIDTISSKMTLILCAQDTHTPIISSMGAGNKKQALSFKISDIYSTDTCPLARVMRKELRARGVIALKVLCSSETPATCLGETNCPDSCKQRAPGSNAFVPASAGLIIAGEVVNDLVRGAALSD